MNLSDRTINPLTTRRAVFQQQGNAALTYSIDYTAMLNGDAITASTWACRDAISIAPSLNGQVASAFVGGKAGNYTIVNKITTASGQTDERLIVLNIRANDEGVQGDYV